MTHYKAIRQDGTSHHDSSTRWPIGEIVEVKNPDPASIGPCGIGLNTSPTLLDAVTYHQGSSDYLRVEVIDPIAADNTKTRSRALRVVAQIDQTELDELAGFKLWEANRPVNPLLIKSDISLELELLVRQWASVRASVGASVRDSV